MFRVAVGCFGAVPDFEADVAIGPACAYGGDRATRAAVSPEWVASLARAVASMPVTADTVVVSGHGPQAVYAMIGREFGKRCDLVVHRDGVWFVLPRLLKSKEALVTATRPITPPEPGAPAEAVVLFIGQPVHSLSDDDCESLARECAANGLSLTSAVTCNIQERYILPVNFTDVAGSLAATVQAVAADVGPGKTLLFLTSLPIQLSMAVGPFLPDGARLVEKLNAGGFYIY